MRTWSLTPFFNELDLLEIRLATLDAVIDVHVIAEATRTYSGHPKPLHFREHADRFAPWRDKIRYVVVDDMPDGDRTVAPARLLQAAAGDHHWRRENHQREALGRGLEGMRPDDKVLVSDLDEILRPEIVREVNVRRGRVWNRFGQQARVRPSMALHLYWLNWRWSELHRTPIASFTSGAVLMGLGVQRFRMLPGIPYRPSIASGWHFSYMGGPQAVHYKLTRAAHQEVNTPDYTGADWIRRCTTTGRDLFGRRGTMAAVPVAELPSYVQQHPDRFAHMMGSAL